MSSTDDDLTPAGSVKFDEARKCLLPNEDVRFFIATERGFLVTSNRRMLLLEETKDKAYLIQKVIPLDCFHGIESKKSDCVRLTGIHLDQYGCFVFEQKHGKHQYKLHPLDIKSPKAVKGKDKSEVRNRFQSAMNDCIDVVRKVREAEEFTSDISYLDNMPESLTRNAILDLNTISEDWPIHNELHQKLLKFLGDQPFLLEESLRSGVDRDNGILFAAGKAGYIWIEGEKNGRFMSHVMIDKVEWENIRCLAHQWQNDSPIIEVTYAIHRDGVELTMQYQWSPSADEEAIQYPWLLQPLNGPWILADVMHKCTGKRMAASWISEKHLKQPELHEQRYFL